jgi:hypothetical protein
VHTNWWIWKNIHRLEKEIHLYASIPKVKNTSGFNTREK